MSNTLVRATAVEAAPVEGARHPKAPRSPWVSFAIRRLGAFLGTAVALIVVTFLMVQLIPGDPAVAIAGGDANLAEIEQVRSQLGLDLPLWQQFLSYVTSLLRGDLGTSFMYGQPVATLIANRLPFTLSLSLIAIVLVLAISIPLGMSVGIATRGGRRPMLDTVFGAVTGFLDAVPSYILATVLVATFALGVGLVPILPPAFSARVPEASLVLPIVALIVGPVCTVSRVVRRETARVLTQDHIRTARSWRLPAIVLYLKYALPNILTTTLTLSGLVLGGMLGGALIIESVFAVPGLGSGMIKAILDRDFPVVQGLVLVVGLLVAGVNLLVDIVLGIMDPRTLGGHHAKA